jgi:DNA repair protein RecN (Recombination protein N)
MLQELRVENLLLIEQAHLRLAPGLNVLTGETGAGKTVLAHALDLLLGGRAKAGIVRPGAQEAYVEGVFELPAEPSADLAERLSADAAELVLARRVGVDGRTRAYLNGRSATVAELRDTAAALLAFYGQHEHRKLTLSAAQLEILDGLCGDSHADALRDCASAHVRTRKIEARLAELRELCAQRDRELDLLDYELGEIDVLAPDEGHHDELLALRERLRRQDALQAAAGGAAEALAPQDGEGAGAAQLLAGALAPIDALAGVDPALDALGERARSLMLESQDLAAELRGYAESAAGSAESLSGTGGPEGSLEMVEERLAALERVMRKHGGSVAAVLAFAEGARARRAQLAGAEESIEQAERELEASREELAAHAGALRRGRTRAAGGFGREVR